MWFQLKIIFQCMCLFKLSSSTTMHTASSLCYRCIRTVNGQFRSFTQLFSFTRACAKMPGTSLRCQTWRPQSKECDSLFLVEWFGCETWIPIFIHHIYIFIQSLWLCFSYSPVWSPSRDPLRQFVMDRDCFSKLSNRVLTQPCYPPMKTLKCQILTLINQNHYQTFFTFPSFGIDSFSIFPGKDLSLMSGNDYWRLVLWGSTRQPFLYSQF